MLARPMDILTQFPVRKSKAQKQAFREAVQDYVEQMDYPVHVEEGSLGSRNLIIGDSDGAKYLVTAHYDTCARLPFPNLCTPCSFPLTVLHQLGLFSFILLVPMAIGLVFGLGAMFLYGYCSELSDKTVMAAIGKTVFDVLYIGLVFLNIFLIYAGPANKVNANDNTSGVVTLLEIARTLPENMRHKVCFVLFDNEEKGLWGSRSYRKSHKEATDHQIVLNLDCVGDGDHIRMFPMKKLKKDRKKLTSLYKACGYVGKKSILVHEKGFSSYPSDQKQFPYGVGICALRKNKLCYYLSRIHTAKDTILDETNVNILRAALTSFICCDS